MVSPRATAAAASTKTKQASKAKKPARRKADPVKQWANYLHRYRPGLQRYVLDALVESYGPQVWEARLDPTSELILTILTQNTADVNAEKAYEALRVAYPSDREPEVHKPGIGWGGDGLSTAPPPDWSRVEHAPLPELIDVIRPGGLGPQKAPRIQATLQRIREERGDYSLAFLGDLPALEAPRLAHLDRRDRQEDGLDRARLLLRDPAHGGGPARRAGRRSGSGCCRRRRPPTRRTTCSWASSSRTRCTRRTSCSSTTAGSSATPSGRSTTCAPCGIAAGS